jgi:serine/threonine protein kinase
VDQRTTPVMNRLGAGSEIGPYRLLRLLGTGGMAEVFMAEHRHLAQIRAVKVLLPESLRNPDLVGRLLTEARAIARLHHPAIVEVYECDTLPGGGAFIAMAYLRGEPACNWLGRVGTLRGHPALAAAMVGVVADALEHAHRQSVVHRDIKPENLLLVPSDSTGHRFSIKVLDFGIAKVLGGQPLSTTQTGSVLGTPYYMAPEQWEPSATAGPRADIYSLGCVFFELLCGRPPFGGGSALEVMNAHFSHPVPDIRALVPELPVHIEQLLARMLAKAPEDRPRSMEEIVATLERFLECDRAQFPGLLQTPADFPVVAGHTEEGDLFAPGVPAPDRLVAASRPVAHTTPIASRNRTLHRLVGAVVCAATIVVGIGLLSARHKRAPSPAAAIGPESPGAPAPPPRTQAAMTAPRPPAISMPPPDRVELTAPPVRPVPAPPAAQAEAAPPKELASPRNGLPADKPAPTRAPSPRKARPRNVYLPMGD